MEQKRAMELVLNAAAFQPIDDREAMNIDGGYGKAIGNFFLSWGAGKVLDYVIANPGKVFKAPAANDPCRQTSYWKVFGRK